MDARMQIANVTGPFREPREQVFSFDYSIQRVSWPTAQAIRVKVSIPEELDIVRAKVLGDVVGTPGQQLMISKFLSRQISDEKSVSPRRTVCCRSAAIQSWLLHRAHGLFVSTTRQLGD